MANNTRIVKKANRFLILRAIRGKQKSTVEDIAASTKLSRPTILTILKNLVDERIVATSGVVKTESGRHPVQYVLNTKSRFAIGIDVDGPPINLVVSDLNGSSLYSASWTMQLEDPGEVIVAGMVREIDKAVASLDISYSQVIGISVGLPAVVDTEANTTIQASRFPNWQNYPIAQVLSKHTGVAVSIRRDGNLLGIAEHRALAQCESSLYYIHRSGLGLAVIMGNQLYEGETGNAGYIGHTTLIPNGRPCDCGDRGCVEAYCSKRAIVKDYLEQSGVNLTYVEILDKAARGDVLASGVVGQAGEVFGIAISNSVKCYEIYTIILGDIMCGQDHPFFRSIVKSAHRHLSNFTNRPLRILTGGLDRASFGLGGCHHVLSEYFMHPNLNLGASEKTAARAFLSASMA